MFAAKVAAAGTNVVTFVFAFGLLLVPGIARAIWSRRSRPDVRAYAGLLVLVFLVESLVFTLHSTRGSYFHSLAAFFPFGVALGVVGTHDLLRSTEGRRLAAAAGIVAAVIVSTFSVSQWDISFNTPYRERAAIVDRLPPGGLMAIDAAAWRWIADRPAVVTPANLGPCAIGYAADLDVVTLVLERVHFTSYDPLYRGAPTDAYIGPPVQVGDFRLYRVDARRARVLCASTL